MTAMTSYIPSITDSNSISDYLAQDNFRLMNLKDSKSLAEDYTCPICMDSLNTKRVLEHIALNSNPTSLAATKVFHRFHEECIVKSYRRNDSCPLCRKFVELPDYLMPPLEPRLQEKINNTVFNISSEQLSSTFRLPGIFNAMLACAAGGLLTSQLLLMDKISNLSSLLITTIGTIGALSSFFFAKKTSFEISGEAAKVGEAVAVIQNFGYRKKVNFFSSKLDLLPQYPNSELLNRTSQELARKAIEDMSRNARQPIGPTKTAHYELKISINIYGRIMYTAIAVIGIALAIKNLRAWF